VRLSGFQLLRYVVFTCLLLVGSDPLTRRLKFVLAYRRRVSALSRALPPGAPGLAIMTCPGALRLEVGGSQNSLRSRYEMRTRSSFIECQVGPEAVQALG